MAFRETALSMKIKTKRGAEAARQKTAVQQSNSSVLSPESSSLELLKQEPFFRILQKAPYGVILVDRNGKYVYVNPEFTNITGYKPEEVPTGRDLLHKAYPDSQYRQKVREAWRTDILQKGVTWVFSLVRRDGQTREIEFKPTLLDDGRVVVMLSDVTERKQAEDGLRRARDELNLSVQKRTAELERSNRLLKQEIAERERIEKAHRESEERYRALVKHSSDGILIFDLQSGRVLEANDQFLKMLGYREEDVTQLKLRDIVFFENKTVREANQRALETGHEVYGMRQYKRADGTFLDVEVGATMINYGSEQVVMVNIRDVTERARAERALRESEDRYRTIFETTGCATAMIDQDMTLSLVNTQFEKLSGYSKEEIEGKKNWTEFLDPTEAGKLIEYHHMRREDPGAVPRNYEFQFLTRSGEVRTIFITGALIPGTKKSVLSLLDLTGLVRAEKALRETDRRYRALFEESRDAIYINRLDGTLVDCNQSMLDLFGYTREEILQLEANDFYARPEDRERFKRDIAQTGFVREYEVRFRKKDGSGMDCLLTSTFWRANDDTVLGYQGIIHDITERKRVEEGLLAMKDELELRVTERTAQLQNTNEKLRLALAKGKRVEEMLRKGAERYRDLFQNSPIGIYRTNSRGLILMANHALVRMLGFNSFTEITTNEIEEDDYEPTYLQKDFRRRLERDGRVRGYEATWKRPDGTVIFVSENARAVKSDDGTVLYYEGTVEDITEKKEAEEKIERYQEELRSLASKLSLAEERERRRIASILHDTIGQLLAVSKIKLWSLLEATTSSEVKIPANDALRLLEQAIKHTRSLTSELSPPILYELGFEAALEWLGEQMQKQHGFTFTFDNDNEPKPVDEEMRIFLFTSVRELLVNVVKHAGAHHVRVSVRKINNEIVTEVADDGVGFSTTVADWASSGFGLFSIKERLRHLGGRIAIDSLPGHGTRIRLSVPSDIKNRHTRESAT